MMEMLNSEMVYVVLVVLFLVPVYCLCEETLLQSDAKERSTMLAWQNRYYAIELAAQEKRLQEMNALAAYTKQTLPMLTNGLPEKDGLPLMVQLDAQFKKMMQK